MKKILLTCFMLWAVFSMLHAQNKGIHPKPLVLASVGLNKPIGEIYPIGLGLPIKNGWVANVMPALTYKGLGFGLWFEFGENPSKVESNLLNPSPNGERLTLDGKWRHFAFIPTLILQSKYERKWLHSITGTIGSGITSFKRPRVKYESSSAWWVAPSSNSIGLSVKGALNFGFNLKNRMVFILGPGFNFQQTDLVLKGIGFPSSAFEVIPMKNYAITLHVGIIQEY